jgi:hypothetical protein
VSSSASLADDCYEGPQIGLVVEAVTKLVACVFLCCETLTRRAASGVVTARQEGLTGAD